MVLPPHDILSGGERNLTTYTWSKLVDNGLSPSGDKAAPSSLATLQMKERG